MAGMTTAVGPLLLIFAATCSFYVVIAPLLLGHTDLGWHLAAGDLIRNEGRVPAYDPWSYTAGATRWYNHTWLWDVIASLLFAHGGFTALILATILLGGVIAVSLAAICLAGSATPVATRPSRYLTSSWPPPPTSPRCCFASPFTAHVFTGGIYGSHRLP
jgi:hypothetical protein